jgi:hypothetical protein
MKKEKLCVCAVFCVQKCMCVYVYIYIYCVNVGGGREEERLPSLLPQHTLHTPHTHIYLPTHTPLHTHTHPTRSLHILYTPLLPPTNRIFFGYPTLLPPNVRRIKTHLRPSGSGRHSHRRLSADVRPTKRLRRPVALPRSVGFPEVVGGSRPLIHSENNVVFGHDGFARTRAARPRVAPCRRPPAPFGWESLHRHRCVL